MSDSVKCKKFHALYMAPEWRGMVFIKTGGVLREMGGVFFKMGRGIGGILAGYLNYWRPNLPISKIFNTLKSFRFPFDTCINEDQKFQ